MISELFVHFPWRIIFPSGVLSCRLSCHIVHQFTPYHPQSKLTRADRNNLLRATYGVTSYSYRSASCLRDDPGVIATRPADLCFGYTVISRLPAVTQDNEPIDCSLGVSKQPSAMIMTEMHIGTALFPSPDNNRQAAPWTG